MIAVLDIFALAPDFKTAVFAVHDSTTPVALVICFAGLIMCVQRALHERSVGAILPALIQISIVSLIIGNMPAIGNAIEHRGQCRCAHFETRLMNRRQWRLQNARITHVIHSRHLNLGGNTDAECVQ